MDATSSNLGIPSSKEFVRTHGFQFPLNFYQILSWIIFLFEFCATILLFIASLPIALKIVGGILILITMSATVYYAYLATKCDPTDPTVIEEKRCRATG